MLHPIGGRTFITHTKGAINIKELTAKELLFCTYFSLGRNPREAAVKSGFIFPEKYAMKLLGRKDIQEEIARLDKQRRATDKDIAMGFSRLAFGCVSDAVSLLFRDEVSGSDIEKMDLFNVAEIKRKKSGDIEIRFFDRLKALEKLTEITEAASEENENTIFHAIQKGAAALRNDQYE